MTPNAPQGGGVYGVDRVGRAIGELCLFIVPTNPSHRHAPAPLTGRRCPDPALAPLLVRRVSAASGAAAASADESAAAAKDGHCSRLASPTNTQPSQEILQAGQLQLAERALPTVRPSLAPSEPRALLANGVAWPKGDARRVTVLRKNASGGDNNF